MPNRTRTLIGFRVIVGCATAVIACSSPDAAIVSPPRTDSGALWSVTLDHRAVTISTVVPYDTIRLTATPRDAAGNAIGGLVTPTFTSSDVKTLQVDSVGLVHALATGSGVMVIATLSSGGYTLADTAVINVTDTTPPPMLSVLSIHPDSADSAETSVDFPRTLQTRTLDGAGDSISGLSVYYTSSDNSVALIDRSAGVIQGVYPGHVTFTATATAYGVTKTDTVLYVIGYPVIGVFQIVPLVEGGRSLLGFSPGHITVGTGASVAFQTNSTMKIDVTFDDSTQVGRSWLCPYFPSFPWVCGIGNIAPFASDSTVPLSGVRLRGFPVPGTYNFHSTLFGTTGQITVVDWRSLR